MGRLSGNVVRKDVVLFVRYCINNIITPKQIALDIVDMRDNNPYLFIELFYLCLCNISTLDPYVQDHYMLDTFCAIVTDESVLGLNISKKQNAKMHKAYTHYKKRFQKKLLIGSHNIIKINSYPDKGYSSYKRKARDLINYIEKMYGYYGREYNKIIYVFIFIGISVDILQYYTELEKK